MGSTSTHDIEELTEGLGQCEISPNFRTAMEWAVVIGVGVGLYGLIRMCLFWEMF
jgi:hypothetical protein